MLKTSNYFLIKVISVEVNRGVYTIKKNLSVLEGCKYLGLVIPRFCYHEMLSVAGNCRMCLVEVVMGSLAQKPVVSCAMPFLSNMKILLDTPLLQKARANVVEMLLLYHPLDCPVCDQAGECDLQDQTKIYGVKFSRHFFHKRGVENKNSGPIVKTIMSRCIHCTRCVRFNQEILGSEVLGTINRGVMTEISSYDMQPLLSELSGNIVDLCPVGALTLKPYAFKTRPWELKISESIDLTDSLGSNIFIHYKNLEIFRVLPKINKNLNASLISDKARFFYDSLLHNRLIEPLKLGKPCSTESMLFEILKAVQSKKKLLILCNSEISLEVLFLLKLLTYHYSNLKIKSIMTEFQQKNFYSGLVGLVNSIAIDSKVCLLFSLNLQVESVLLNYKLRKKFLHESLEIHSFLNFFNTNNFSTFINLNVKSFQALLKGKNRFFGQLVKETTGLGIIIGEETLYKRGIQALSIVQLFKSINFKTQSLIIGNTCNSAGAKLSHLKCFTKNDVLMARNVFCLNLPSGNVSLRRLLETPMLIKFWFNTHYSALALKANFSYPLAADYMTSGIFLNCETRPQLSSQIFLRDKVTTSLDDLLKFLLNTNKQEKLLFPFLEKEKSVILEPALFENKRLFDLTLTNFAADLKKVSLYPLKAISYDHYLSTKQCENSKILINCSLELRKKCNQQF